MVGGVISAKVGAVGCVSDSGSAWRGGARVNKIGLVVAGACVADHGAMACRGVKVRMKISRPC
jgi:hypothetical protein